MDIIRWEGSPAESTGEIKSILGQLFSDLAQSGWKRRSKRKEGEVVVRVFEHTNGTTVYVGTIEDRLAYVRTAEEQAAGSPEPQPTYIRREGTDAIYKPSECIFAIHCEDGRIIVLIEPKWHWAEEHCMNDFIGGHSFEEGVLDSASVWEKESTEGQFDSLEDDVETARTSMIRAGFEFSPEYQRYIDSQDGGGDDDQEGDVEGDDDDGPNLPPPLPPGAKPVSGREVGYDGVYQPNQCIFAIIGSQVFITPKWYWQEEHHLADFIGGHSFEEDLLDRCGVSGVEELEATFTLLQEPATARRLLTEAGFEYDNEFEAFLREHGSDDGSDGDDSPSSDDDDDGPPPPPPTPLIKLPASFIASVRARNLKKL